MSVTDSDLVPASRAEVAMAVTEAVNVTAELFEARARAYADEAARAGSQAAVDALVGLIEERAREYAEAAARAASDAMAATLASVVAQFRAGLTPVEGADLRSTKKLARDRNGNITSITEEAVMTFRR